MIPPRYRHKKKNSTLLSLVTCPCAHFDAICDPLLHRHTVPRKLFAEVIIFTRLSKFPRVLLRKRESGSRVCFVFSVYLYFIYLLIYFLIRSWNSWSDGTSS